MISVVLLLVVAAWSVVIGVLKIIAAIRLRREIAKEWFLALGEAVSVLFGIYVFANPGRGCACACVADRPLRSRLRHHVHRGWVPAARIGPSVPRPTGLDRG